MRSMTSWPLASQPSNSESQILAVSEAVQKGDPPRNPTEYIGQTLTNRDRFPSLPADASGCQKALHSYTKSVLTNPFTSKRSSRKSTSVDASSPHPFLVRNEFLLRRLHSLSGLIPVGAYMCVHLITNASVIESPATFQKNVYSIHSLGSLLPIIEWGFIFIPILFHAIFGVVIIRSGLTNHGSYPTTRNYRYTLQRASGMIAFLFIAWHVFHMHGWFHADWWRSTIAEPLGGAKFTPYRAASSAATALSGSIIVPILYAVGIISCVFHLANGIWTMGITWGLWVSEAAQRRANIASIVFGLGLGFIGLSALGGMRMVDVEAATQAEDQMFESKIASGELQDNDRTRDKRGEHAHAEEGEEIETSASQID